MASGIHINLPGAERRDVVLKRLPRVPKNLVGMVPAWLRRTSPAEDGSAPAVASPPLNVGLPSSPFPEIAPLVHIPSGVALSRHPEALSRFLRGKGPKFSAAWVHRIFSSLSFTLTLSVTQGDL
jgi:hypothetical protein